MEVDREGLEILGRRECLDLLALRTLGRVGFTRGALPTVVPVAFHLDGHRILVRTPRGGTLAAALRDSVVAFEVDDVDPVLHSGWSVSVTGLATEVGDPATATGDDVVLAISTELVSGRRVPIRGRDAGLRTLS